MSQTHGSAVLSAVFKEITQELIESNHNQQDIANCIADVKLRLEWDKNSYCSIFAPSQQEWVKGEIYNIHQDNKTNEEWLSIKYNHKHKNMKRFCKDIKPLNFRTNCDNKIILYIAKQLKEKQMNP
eukprot:478294_1